MSAGNKLVITAAAEEQAKTRPRRDGDGGVGGATPHPRGLEPVDDVVQRLIAQYGPDQRG